MYVARKSCMRVNTHTQCLCVATNECTSDKVTGWTTCTGELSDMFTRARIIWKSDCYFWQDANSKRIELKQYLSQITDFYTVKRKGARDPLDKFIKISVNSAIVSWSAVFFFFVFCSLDRLLLSWHWKFFCSLTSRSTMPCHCELETEWASRLVKRPHF